MRKFMNKKLNKRKLARKMGLGAIAVLVSGIILFPIVWMLPAAFKGRREVWAIPNTWWPENFTWVNFEKIFTLEHNGYNFVSSLGSTFLVAVIAVVLSLVINMMAAYVFSNLEFRGKKFLWGYFLVTMFIPGITILLTSIRVVNILQMTDTIWVLIIPGIISAYNIFFFRQFFYSIPSSLEEAATIDGSSHFGVFWRIF